MSSFSLSRRQALMAAPALLAATNAGLSSRRRSRRNHITELEELFDI